MPDLFKNEDELRRLWSRPDTRQKLLEGLAERGFEAAQLDEIKTMINAEKSDLYDVLANIAFAHTPVARKERTKLGRTRVAKQYDTNLQTFLEFILSQYEKEGVGELENRKLPDLLELKYKGLGEATAQLGQVAHIRKAFVDFQRFLYQENVNE